MRNHFLTISFSLLFLPYYNSEKIDEVSFGNERNREDYSRTNNAAVLYAEMNLSDLGLSQQAFEFAYKGYRNLIKKEKLADTSILTICDLSQSSNKKRLYILDLDNNKVLLNTYVAHGRGSGTEYALRFSNKAKSHQSSLGFYLTGSTYYGQNGLSLSMKGLEPGFNDLAARRNIVIHGAAYIGDQFLGLNRCMGRSYGCPAVPENECSTIINLIKGGSCLFIYHSTKNYLKKSKILNG